MCATTRSRTIAGALAQRVAPGGLLVLSGLLVCGECGRNYVIAGRYTYICGSYRNGGKYACGNKLMVKRRQIEPVRYPFQFEFEGADGWRKPYLAALPCDVAGPTVCRRRYLKPEPIAVDNSNSGRQRVSY
ncbi:MAG: recombinase zinc beta ribbon domain-containing protein [Deltaproteobacteria bacterium]|nr:recombinase zinc beta ribbon domain-containing protein [Deltaproteobacteria bacterium]